MLLIASSWTLTAQENKGESDTKGEDKEKKVDFTVMPFLSYNRNLEFMFGAIPMAMYRTNVKDTISPKSLSGAVGIYTTNESFFIGFFNKWYFKEDSWRAQFFIGFGDFISQFFVDEVSTPDFYNFGTNATVLSTGLKRRIIPNLYGGINYTYAKYNSVFEDDIFPASSTVTHGIELNALYDTRDNVYYPRTGIKSDIKWINYGEWIGNDLEANKINTIFNTYLPTRDNKDVIAARFSGTFGLGDLAFEQQTVVGGNDIRGYSDGKYRGDTVLAVQGEYRLNVTKRIGFVGFVGAATVYGSDNEDFNGIFLPGGGVGVRYGAFKAMKFNIGLDAAVGKDDWGVYFKIGEAF